MVFTIFLRIFLAPLPMVADLLAGVPRWPHRKLKCLDKRINDAQAKSEESHPTGNNNVEIARLLQLRESLVSGQKPHPGTYSIGAIVL